MFFYPFREPRFTFHTNLSLFYHFGRPISGLCQKWPRNIARDPWAYTRGHLTIVDDVELIILGEYAALQYIVQSKLTTGKVSKTSAGSRPPGPSVGDRSSFRVFSIIMAALSVTRLHRVATSSRNSSWYASFLSILSE